MKIEQNANQTILKDTLGDFELFLEKLPNELSNLSTQNVIIDLTENLKVSNATIKQFVTLSKLHKKNKKSFVIVASGIDFTAVPAALTVVPSSIEAKDIIELEDMERDLGF
jgi:hypothetical protein